MSLPPCDPPPRLPSITPPFLARRRPLAHAEKKPYEMELLCDGRTLRLCAENDDELKGWLVSLKRRIGL